MLLRYLVAMKGNYVKRLCDIMLYTNPAIPIIRIIMLLRFPVVDMILRYKAVVLS